MNLGSHEFSNFEQAPSGNNSTGQHFLNRVHLLRGSQDAEGTQPYNS